jgi:hypothetical protein
MLTEFQDYLTFENIYIWSNFFVFPFWLMLIFIPKSKITQIFINSIILPLLLASGYIFVFYQIILFEEPIFDLFQLYTGLDSLYTVFSNEGFLLLFWLHFLSISLFLGSWISNDSMKYNMSLKIVVLPLILTYFSGPVGFVIYWLIRVFYAKKLRIHDQVI